MRGDSFWAKCVICLLEMIRPVLAEGDALQVGQIVIERIVIPVVNVVARRDGAMTVFPNLLMQSLNTPHAVSPARCEIDPIRSAQAIGIASKDDTFIDDGFHFGLWLSLC